MADCTCCRSWFAIWIFSHCSSAHPAVSECSVGALPSTWKLMTQISPYCFFRHLIKYSGTCPCPWQKDWNYVVLPTQTILWIYKSTRSCFLDFWWCISPSPVLTLATVLLVPELTKWAFVCRNKSLVLPFLVFALVLVGSSVHHPQRKLLPLYPQVSFLPFPRAGTCGEAW